MNSKIYNDGKISGPQLESIVYACQSHETFLKNKERHGFFIGDGAGVGKGRIIAGIILENIIQKREKIIWFSASNDLIFDAKRDLDDIGLTCDFPNFSLKLLTDVFLNFFLF
jgi:Na+-transporting NADH:ubiquinone oxidoreductase subunit NqrF